MHKCCLCYHPVSVCLSVTLVDCIHMAEDIDKLLVRSGSPITLVFNPQRHYSIPSGGIKYMGMGKIGDYGLKSPFISELVRDRIMVAMQH